MPEVATKLNSSDGGTSIGRESSAGLADITEADAEAAAPKKADALGDMIRAERRQAVSELPKEVRDESARERPAGEGPAGKDRGEDLGFDALLGKEFQVLDHGFVRVIDYMGSDLAIVQAARVSYGKGTKKISEDRRLIRYLMRHRHSTPFEMCEIKFHVKLPIFVARQWVRHRTANINEYSARYSILDKEFYVPDRKTAVGRQSETKKQGRQVDIGGTEALEYMEAIQSTSNRAYTVYENLLNETVGGEPIDPEHSGLARELARIVLPTNYYTQWYWKIDLHNLLHFISLRADEHAQYEIQQYARTICEIVSRWVPLTWEAFADYRLESVCLSRLEAELISRLLNGDKVELATSGLTKRELSELSQKVKFKLPSV
jgi:thymidylate synthase (FAD)